MSASICQGGSYTFNNQELTATGIYRDTLQAVNSCDSFIVLNLTVKDTFNTELTVSICQGESYAFNNQELTTSGVYRDTLQAITSCDSFIVLNLSIKDTLQTELTVSICEEGSYSFNNQELTTSGVYRDTLQAVTSCDSFIVLNLTVQDTFSTCLLYTSPSPRDLSTSRMPSSA